MEGASKGNSNILLLVSKSLDTARRDANAATRLRTVARTLDCLTNEIRGALVIECVRREKSIRPRPVLPIGFRRNDR